MGGSPQAAAAIAEKKQQKQAEVQAKELEAKVKLAWMKANMGMTEEGAYLHKCSHTKYIGSFFVGPWGLEALGPWSLLGLGLSFVLGPLGTLAIPTCITVVPGAYKCAACPKLKFEDADKLYTHAQRHHHIPKEVLDTSVMFDKTKVHPAEVNLVKLVKDPVGAHAGPERAIGP